MAGFRIITMDVDAKEAVKSAGRTAEDLGFAVEQIGDFSLTAGKGSLFVSLLVGAFVAYCDFKIHIDPIDGGRKLEVTLERNTPWWTGLIGLNRVKNAAKALADAIAEDLERRGARIVKEDAF